MLCSIKPQTPLSVLLYNHVCGSVVQLVVQNYKISSGSWKSHTHIGCDFLTYWSQTYHPLRHSKWKFFNLVLFLRKLLCRGSFDNSVIVKEHFLEIFVRQISD